jgi:hypothetical protein
MRAESAHFSRDCYRDVGALTPDDSYGDEALVRCRAMRAAVARLLAHGDQADPGGLP